MFGQRNILKVIISILAVLLILTAGVYLVYKYKFKADSGKPKDTISKIQEKKFFNNQVLVKLSQRSIGNLKKGDEVTPTDTGIAELDTINTTFKATKVEKVFKNEATDPVLSRWYLITFKAKQEIATGNEANVIVPIEEIENLSYGSILNQYKNLSITETAEPNYIAQALSIPNDTYFSTRQIFADHDDLWGLKKISAPTAWDTTIGNDIKIAVVDTGVDYNHPDLAGNILKDGAGKIIGYDFYNNDSNPMDDHFHGTHVAGTIAAIGNNDPNHAIDSGTRIVGVAYGAKIMPIKALGASGSGPATALSNGIKYAADNGAKIVNNSWGGSGNNTLFDDVIKYAYDRGTLNVFAAGNEATDVVNTTPAGNPYVITVGATNYLDQLACFSNYGANVDFTAPGGDISSSDCQGIGNDYILSSRLADSTQITGTLGDNYAVARGTSMATPHVVGAAALVMAAHPDFSLEEVRFALRNTADKIDSVNWDSRTGFGRINVANAIGVTSAPPVAQLLIPEHTLYRNELTHIQGNVSARNGVRSWTLSINKENAQTAWSQIAAGSIAQSGELGSFNTADYDSGIFDAKLEVTDNLGNISQTYARFQIDLQLMTGWPIGALFGMQPVFGDITGDSKSEIIYTSWDDKVYAYNADGTIVTGFPVSTSIRRAVGTYNNEATLADLDNDGKMEIIVATWYNYTKSAIYAQIWAFKGNGTQVSGWPVVVNNETVIKAPATVADINGDGRLEILINGRATTSIYVYQDNGTALSGWPQLATSDIRSYPSGSSNDGAVAVSDVNGDGKSEVFLGSSSDAKVHAFSYDGQKLAGWPQAVAVYPDPTNIYATVGIADINGDGQKEIIAKSTYTGASHDSRYNIIIKAFRANGSTLWTVNTPGSGWGNAGPAFVDLQKNNTYAIFMPTENAILGLNGSGTALTGWPRRDIGTFYASAAVADIDGDGKPEIITGNDNYNYSPNLGLVALSATGQMVWQREYARSWEGASIGDIDGDGRLEMAAILWDNMLYVWKLNSTVTANTLVWPQLMGDAAHTGIYVEPVVPVPDTTAPTVSISSPANNATVSGTVMISAAASDNVGVVKTEFYQDNSLVGTDTSAPYSVAWDSTKVLNGPHVLTAKAYDAAGNVGTAAAVSITVNNTTDTTAPTVSVTSPANGSIVVVRSTQTITAIATDNIGVVRVEFYISGQLGCTDTATPYTCSWKVPNAKNKIYLLTAKAYDAAGNVGTSAPVSVTAK